MDAGAGGAPEQHGREWRLIHVKAERAARFSLFHRAVDWQWSGRMAFIQQLIAHVEEGQLARPRNSDSRHAIDVSDEVLKFAPKKIRFQHQTAEDRIEQLETEIRQWQDRAGRAETRLRSIEESIQQIAAHCIRSAARK